jgi:radical SAM protein with 4Fe4S-binding SPASM domain
VCPNQDLPEEDRGDMDPELYDSLIKDLSPGSHEINLFHRGEPLIHPQLPWMIQRAGSAGLKTRLHTNATLLSPEMSQKLLSSGLDFISFSFDGYDASSYEKNRRGASFSRTVENIKYFLKLKKARHRKIPETVLQIMDLPSGKTVPEKDQKAFLDSFLRLGLNRMVIRTPHNWGGSILSSRIKEEGKAKKGVCTFPWYALVILWDGRVTPCPQDFSARLTLGRLTDQSLKEIWNGEPMQTLRKKLGVKAYRDLIPCNTCDRPLRKTFLGLPTETMGTFVRELLLGYKEKT